MIYPFLLYSILDGNYLNLKNEISNLQMINPLSVLKKFFKTILLIVNVHFFLAKTEVLYNYLSKLIQDLKFTKK